jgi:hypothetical protein
MKSSLIISFLLIMLLTQCGDKRRREFFENYVKARMEFPVGLTDHFPYELKSIGQLSAITPSGAYGHDMAFFCLAIKSDSLDVIDTKTRLEKVNAKEYEPNDSSLIIVGDTVDYSQKTKGVPIPSFYNYEKDFGLNSVRLDNDFRIYVLESKSGEYMDKENLTKDNKFPPNWRNGFSRGLAINEQEKTIIYWLTIW